MNDATLKDLKEHILYYRAMASNTDFINRMPAGYTDRKETLNKEHKAFAELIDLVKLIEGK